ncbi:thiamine phosphate phosphatase-like protein [Cornus florida]|uniref:thiamine phosphate phosphatase-like protein n=1 Tax=Cornus florida TaxID=4283 RepID=UPI0028991D9A|nr:thiamine phosphate phosphatase-like protein [Cornus florida]
MDGIMIIFDFDRTLIDDDSDRWVVMEMGLTHLFNQLLPKLPWNSLMDRMMKELHSQGISTEEIAECLKRVPLNPQIIEAIKSAHALGCELRIISDANQFFIEKILKHHGIFGFFSEINTNPTVEDREGRLWIFPYHELASSPHCCIRCPPHMCKGLVIERIRASISENEKKRIIYLGDGNGDFCPSLKLEERDHVMPRKKFPLWERIRENPMHIKAEVHEWSDGEELKRILLQLIDTISIQDNIITSNSSQLNSSDCNSKTVLVEAHEMLPPSIPVPLT